MRLLLFLVETYKDREGEWGSSWAQLLSQNISCPQIKSAQDTAYLIWLSYT